MDRRAQRLVDGHAAANALQDTDQIAESASITNHFCGRHGFCVSHRCYHTWEDRKRALQPRERDLLVLAVQHPQQSAVTRAAAALLQLRYTFIQPLRAAVA